MIARPRSGFMAALHENFDVNKYVSESPAAVAGFAPALG